VGDIEATIGAVAFVAVGFGLTVGVEMFRIRTRRPLVDAWMKERGWTPLSIRYKFQLFRPNWLTYFEVEWIDERGRRDEGLVSSTGLLRKRVQLDW
jgi:hypothetical protein